MECSWLRLRLHESSMAASFLFVYFVHVACYCIRFCWVLVIYRFHSHGLCFCSFSLLFSYVILGRFIFSNKLMSYGESKSITSYVLLGMNIRSTLNFEYEQRLYDIKTSMKLWVLFIFLNTHYWSLVSICVIIYIKYKLTVRHFI